MLRLFLVLFFCATNAYSAQEIHDHGAEHKQTFHAFTLEGDVGEASSGSSQGFDFSGWVGSDYNRLWLKSEKKNYGDFEEKFENSEGE